MRPCLFAAKRMQIPVCTWQSELQELLIKILKLYKKNFLWIFSAATAFNENPLLAALIFRMVLGTACAPKRGAVKGRTYMDRCFAEGLELQNTALRAELAALPGLLSSAKLNAAGSIGRAAEKQIEDMGKKLASSQQENAVLKARLLEVEAAADQQSKKQVEEIRNLRYEVSTLHYENEVLQVSLKKHNEAMCIAAERAKAEAAEEAQVHHSVLVEENKHLERLVKQLKKQNNALLDMVPPSPQPVMGQKVRSDGAGSSDVCLSDESSGYTLPSRDAPSRDHHHLPTAIARQSRRPETAPNKRNKGTVLSKIKPQPRPRSGSTSSSREVSRQRTPQ